MNEVGSPFYLAINTRGWNNSKSSWYLEAPLGKNTIGSFLSEARALLEQDAGSSSGKVSNHSYSKTGTEPECWKQKSLRILWPS